MSLFEFADTHQPNYFNPETDIQLYDEEAETWNQLSATPYTLSSLVTALKSSEVEASNVQFAEPIAREYLHHLMETGIAEEFHREESMNRERLVAFANAGYTKGEDLVGSTGPIDISQETGINQGTISEIATNYLDGFSSGRTVANTGPLDELNPADSFSGWELARTSPNKIRWVSDGRYNLTISPVPDGSVTVTCNIPNKEESSGYRKSRSVEAGPGESLTPQEALDRSHKWLDSHQLDYKEDLTELNHIGPVTRDFLALEYGVTSREELREFEKKHSDEFDSVFGSYARDLREALDLVGEKRDEASEQDPGAYADELFLDALSYLGEVAGTQTIAEQVGCDQDTARHHLTKLKDEELVRYETAGGSSWWVLLGSKDN